MKSLMQHHASGRALILPLLFSSGACSLDLSLGDLSEQTPLLVSDGSGASPPSPERSDASARLPPPGLGISLGDGMNAPDMLGDAGDLDADGFAELAVLSVDPATGVQYVHLRYGGPRPSAGAEAFAFDESGAKLELSDGYASQILVSGLYPAGDVDADGFADLFVATAICDGPRAGDGGFLVYGGPRRLSGLLDIASVAAQLRPPERAGNGSGCSSYSFAAPGDIDGDGHSDLVFVHPGPFDGEPGRTPTGESGLYVFYGTSERFPEQTSWSSADAHLSSALSGDPVRDVDMLRVAATGDLDGDGRSEIVVDYSAWREDARQAVIIVPGAADRLAGSLDLLAVETQIPGAFAMPSARAFGDLDGDGFDELLVNLPQRPGPSIFYGSPDLLSQPLDAEHATATFDGGLGPLFPMGDFDGDGDAELGAMRYVANDAQTVVGFDLAIWRGTPARPSETIRFGTEPTLAGARIYPDDNDRYAQLAAPAGDLDGDGATDVLTVSLTLYDSTAFFDNPMLHVHYGSTSEQGQSPGDALPGDGLR